MSTRARSIAFRVGAASVLLAAVLAVDYASWVRAGTAPLAVRLRGGEYAGAVGPGFTINESSCFGTAATCAGRARHVWMTFQPLTLVLSLAALVALTYGLTALWSLRRR